ncbi:MAG: hypothetical protein ABSH56_04675 [Bryobacteraceae bacterium]|jgi:proteasome lid subunit RPN8/RPN11
MKTVDQTDFATWHVPQCPFVIEYSRRVLAEIERVVCEAFHSAPRGGVELAGLLFGTHLDGVVQITAFRPIECEHLHGPGFLVSEKDLENLEALMERSRRDPGLHGSVLVGWFHSHTRSGIFLSDKDLELHSRYFPQKWQVALVLRPSFQAGVRAGFFFQEEDGTIHGQECYREFDLAEAELADVRDPTPPTPGPETYYQETGLAPSPRTARTPQAEWAVNLAAGRSLSSPLPIGSVGGGPPLVAVWASKRKGHSWPWLVAGLALGIGAAFWYQSATPRPASPVRTGPLHLRAIDQAGLLRIEWDRRTLAAKELLGGSLQIQDGETRTNLPLDRAAIRVGSFQVVRHSRVVRVALVIRVLGAGPIGEVTEFRGPMPPAEDASAAVPRPPEADRAPRPESAAGKAVAETAALRPAANRPAEGPSDKKVEPTKESRSADSARREIIQSSLPPPRRETPSEPVSKQTTPATSNPAPPRLQTAEAARPPAPAASSPARPPSVTPATPAINQPPANTASIPHPSAPAPQPSVSATVVSPASAPASAPKAAAGAMLPPTPRVTPLSGHWVHGADAPTGSPFPPESLLLTLNESAGQIRGSFSGSYKVPKNRKLNGKVDFQFAGPAGGSSAHLPFSSADGSTGEVEIIRVAGHIDTIEVVWHSSRDRVTFDDVFQRVP